MLAHEGKWPLQLRFFFCTGPDLAERMTNIFSEQLLSTQWDNSADLKTFIGKSLEATWKDMLISRSLYQEASEAIHEASQGSFLLASLLVDDVVVLSREIDIRDRLLTLPKNLESATPLALGRLERQLDQGNLADLTVRLNENQQARK